MKWIFDLSAILAVISMSFVLYWIKSDAREAAVRLVELRHDIADERAALDILKAEWSHLNRPSRLQDLAERYLSLKIMDADQIVNFDDLPRRERLSTTRSVWSASHGDFLQEKGKETVE